MFSQELTEIHCEKHGRQDVAHMFAGVGFCPVCIRDKLIELGLTPVHEQRRTVRFIEKEQS
jgi:hypothetical protein